MAIVLVHGNPETPAVWAPLIEAWGRDDIITPNLPGFGSPLPSGFAATKEAYLDWLIAELEAIGEPVDLIGHDWGGGLAGRLAMVRPDLLTSWASDAIGLFHPFLDDPTVKIVGVEAGGKGLEGEEHCASLTAGSPGVLHGNRTYLLQDRDGQIKEGHSISAVLDYPGIGPEH